MIVHNVNVETERAKLISSRCMGKIFPSERSPKPEYVEQQTEPMIGHRSQARPSVKSMAITLYHTSVSFRATGRVPPSFCQKSICKCDCADIACTLSRSRDPDGIWHITSIRRFAVIIRCAGGKMGRWPGRSVVVEPQISHRWSTLLN